MKRRTRAMLIGIVSMCVLLGLCAAAYPAVSNWLANRETSQVIATATAATESQSDKLDEAREAARAYNARLLRASRHEFDEADDRIAPYAEQINLTGGGLMATVRIPKIQLELPVYHGTDDDTLQKGLGHLFGTSLPVGGTGTHAVITGHSGMASRRMFTDLNQLNIGDTFCIHVLGEDLWYKVDQILTVLPNETSALAIDPDQDYCTLVTCTPYAVNTHRLLVRGVRIDGDDAAAVVAVTSGTAPVNRELSTWTKQYLYGALFGVCIALGLPICGCTITVGARAWRKRKKGRTKRCVPLLRIQLNSSE